MIWLTLRQFRVAAAAVFALLLVLGTILLTTERPFSTLTAADQEVLYQQCITFVTYVLPALIGVFWGAPLVARELEAGTHRLVWNQSVTRTRWLATKLGVTVLAAVIYAGLVSLAVSWWSSLSHTTSPTRHEIPKSIVDPDVFGARGIVPVGYAVLALLLGVSAGILLRKTVVAMGVTLAICVVVQIALPLLVRPHLLPVEDTVAITTENVVPHSIVGIPPAIKIVVSPPAGTYGLTSQTLDANGNEIEALPESVVCARADAAWTECTGNAAAELGYRQRNTFLSPDRFWAMQAIETALVLALCGLLTWLCFWLMRRRLS